MTTYLEQCMLKLLECKKENQSIVLEEAKDLDNYWLESEPGTLFMKPEAEYNEWNCYLEGYKSENENLQLSNIHAEETEEEISDIELYEKLSKCF